MLHYVSTGSRSFGTQPIAPYRRRRWEFYAVLGGKIAPCFESNKKDPLVTNTLWLFPPASTHGWTGEPGKSSRVAVFHFDEIPLPLQKLTPAEGPLKVPLGRAHKSLLYHAAKEVLPHVWEGNRLLEFYSLRILMDLTLLIFNEIPGVPHSPSAHCPLSRVLAAENLFKNNLEKRFSLADLACQTGTTKGHLRRLFQAVHHCGPKTVMARLQIGHAEHLLASSDLKLEAVAAESGFANVSSFCKAFRRVHGLTPTDYRNSHRPAS